MISVFQFFAFVCLNIVLFHARLGFATHHPQESNPFRSLSLVYSFAQPPLVLDRPVLKAPSDSPPELPADVTSKIASLLNLKQQGRFAHVSRSMRDGLQQTRETSQTLTLRLKSTSLRTALRSFLSKSMEGNPIKNLNLIALDVSWSHSVSREDLEFVAHYFPNLKKLNLKGTQLKNSDLPPIAGLTSLENLNLSANWISNEGLIPLLELRQLKKLNLSYNHGFRFTGITDEGFAFLRNLENLESLNLSGNNKIRGNSFPDLQVLPKLRKLIFRNMNFYHIHQNFIPTLTAFSQLKTLDLSNSNLQPWMYPQLAELHNIRDLKLKQISIEVELLMQLELLIHLEKLDLREMILDELSVESDGPIIFWLLRIMDHSRLREVRMSPHSISDKLLEEKLTRPLFVHSPDERPFRFLIMKDQKRPSSELHIMHWHYFFKTVLKWSNRFKSHSQ